MFPHCNIPRPALKFSIHTSFVYVHIPAIRKAGTPSNSKNKLVFAQRRIERSSPVDEKPLACKFCYSSKGKVLQIKWPAVAILRCGFRRVMDKNGCCPCTQASIG